MLIRGKWHHQGSAAQSAAALQTENENFRLEIEGGRTYSGKLHALQVGDRLANVERKITFEDGSVFSSQDNDAIDEVFKHRKTVNAFIHALESHIGWVAIALLLTVVFSFSFFKWGVPWTSEKIADALPQKTNELIAAETLGFLDKLLFEESTLDKVKTEQIVKHFKSKLIPLDENNKFINYKIHFREWKEGEKGIANALALPSGDIILTDEFVKLCENQDEIDAVLLHEMGHIVHRHTLKMIIQSAFVTTTLVLISGDSSGLADMGVGLGALLVSTNYSRNHESEADMYAFNKMLLAKIDPQAFSDIMNRMSESTKRSNSQISEKTDGNVFDYLSTHPSTSMRVEQATRYSKCFHAGNVICESAILNREQ